MNKILELIKQRLSFYESFYESIPLEGENPTIFLKCENGRNLEITKQSNENFYRIYYHCSVEEFDEGGPAFIKEWQTAEISTTTFKEPELIELLANILSIIK